MLKNLKFYFLCVLLVSMTSCSEEEILEPRREGQTGAATERIFNGSFDNSAGSQTFCPNGAGAQLVIDFTTQGFGFDFPELNLNGDVSNDLTTANDTKVLDTPASLNSTTGAFSATYSFEDADSLFDGGDCVASGETYALRSLFTISGNVDNSFILNAQYSFSNVCTGTAFATAVCSGTYTAAESK